MKKDRSKLYGMFLAILGATFWGGSGVFAQFLMESKDISTSWLVGVRMLFAGIIVLFFITLRQGKLVLRPVKVKKDLITLIIFSLFGVIALQFSFFKAIETSNAATATILQYLAPIFLVIYFIIKSQKLPSKLSMFSVCLSLFGTFLLVTGGNIKSLAISGQGLMWGLSAGFFGAFYIIQPRKLLEKYGTTLIIGWGMFFGGLFFQIIHPIWKDVPKIDGATVLGVLFIVIFGTIFSYMCLLKSTSYIPAQFASLLTSFEPLSSALLSSLFLGSVLNKVEIVSMFVIIFAVFLLSRAEDA